MPIMSTTLTNSKASTSATVVSGGRNPENLFYRYTWLSSESRNGQQIYSGDEELLSKFGKGDIDEENDWRRLR